MSAGAGGTTGKRVAEVRVSEPGTAPGMSVEGIRVGTKEYRNAGLALFLAGFASFSLLYSVQPLLPDLSKAFVISPAESSLALSLTTGFLAFSIVLTGSFGQGIDRKRLMFVSMILGSLLNIVAVLLPSWHGMLIARAIEGFVLGGVPAVAMGWVAEEIEVSSLAKSMGLYVGGTAFGGMMGRVGIGILLEFMNWRMAMITLGGMCFVSALAFFLLLPESRHVRTVSKYGLSSLLEGWGKSLRNAKLRRLFLVGFLLTGIFVSLYNYATFRLSQAPYELTPTQISMIFLAFLCGMVSSAMAGGFADTFGRGKVLAGGFALMLTGILMTAHAWLAVIVTGIILLTTGFFVCHAIASGSIGLIATGSKGQAASIYLLFYYLGSSILGSVSGLFWQAGGWTAIVLFTGTLALIGLLGTARFEVSGGEVKG